MQSSLFNNIHFDEVILYIIILFFSLLNKKRICKF